jgi:hypothetical protein
MEWTGRTIQVRCKEQIKHILLGQPYNSAVAECKLENEASRNFGNTSLPNKAPGYMDFLIKEAIKISLHPRNFNRSGVSTSVGPST